MQLEDCLDNVQVTFKICLLGNLIPCPPQFSPRRERHVHSVTVLVIQRLLLICSLQIQELRGNIRVFCRCRHDSCGPCSLQFEDEERVVCRTNQGRRKVFEFEKVYTPDTTQEKVWGGGWGGGGGGKGG